jgi:hypothetical protein
MGNVKTLLIILVVGCLTLMDAPTAWSGGSTGPASCQVDRVRNNASVLVGAASLQIQNLDQGIFGDVDAVFRLRLVGSNAPDQFFRVHVTHGLIDTNLNALCTALNAQPKNSTGQTILEAFGFNPRSQETVVTQQSITASNAGEVPGTDALPGGIHFNTLGEANIYVQ